MPQPHLKLYVDIVSPFGYMGWYVTRVEVELQSTTILMRTCIESADGSNSQNSPVFAECEMEIVPIFLGGLMQKCKNQTPLDIKNKDKYIGAERHRHAKLFKVPIAHGNPTPFPQSTISVMRAITAVSRSNPEKLDACLQVVYRMFWQELQSMSKEEVWTAAIREALGREEGDRIIAMSKTAEGKKALIDNTDRAFDDGAFGLPYFVATNAEGVTEGFWGMSHLGLAVEHLGLDRKLDGGFRASL